MNDTLNLWDTLFIVNATDKIVDYANNKYDLKQWNGEILVDDEFLRLCVDNNIQLYATKNSKVIKLVQDNIKYECICSSNSEGKVYLDFDTLKTM